MHDQSTSRRFGRDIEVGDDLFFLNKPYRVLAMEPYDGPHVQNGTLPVGTRIARSHNGWGVTIDPEMTYEVG